MSFSITFLAVAVGLAFLTQVTLSKRTQGQRFQTARTLSPRGRSRGRLAPSQGTRHQAFQRDLAPWSRR